MFQLVASIGIFAIVPQKGGIESCRIVAIQRIGDGMCITIMTDACLLISVYCLH